MFIINIIGFIIYLNVALLNIFHSTSILDELLPKTFLYELYRFIPLSGKMFSIASLIFIVVLFTLHYHFYKKLSPRYRVKIADKTIKRIRKLNLSNPEIISYLRKIDPFVFEEFLLTLLNQNGYKIKRNKKYTGDGGSDGQAWLFGQHYHIQAKRYKNHISKQHMKEFIQLTIREKSKGIFIHTGKTGKETKDLAEQYDIEIISGDKLCKLVKGH